jgi:phosphopantothenoylcysteine decarboxylase/phosphopantothenate--cysteine ligase
MLEPDEIADIVTAPGFAAPATARVLAGKTVVITAGPTREPIDPVRYLSNRSSGKMGYALVAAAARAGARVILISGPVALPPPRGVEVHDVVTAADMHAATHAVIGEADIFIAAAAVADYRPAEVATAKIKKSGERMTLELVRTEDILASVAALDDAPFTVGFAAETHDLERYARGKLENKRLDMVVANSVGEGKAFDSDQNAVEVHWREGTRAFPLAAKARLARELVELIAARYEARFGTGTEPRLSVISTRE